MNETLLLLWAGDVSENLATMLGLTGLVGVVVIGIVGVVRLDAGDPFWTAWLARFFAIFMGLLLFASVLPSKTIFYLAAGGTAITQTLNTDLGKKLTRLVEQKLDEALGEEK